MTNRLVSLLLLFACGCVLIAGPHPCHADGLVAARPAGDAGACHSQEPMAEHAVGPGVATAEGSDSCREHGPLCESLCHMVGIVRVEVPTLSMQPLAAMVAPGFEHPLPLFAHPIDHVPLA